jgi:hypothetical protein
MRPEAMFEQPLLRRLVRGRELFKFRQSDNKPEQGGCISSSGAADLDR